MCRKVFSVKAARKAFIMAVWLLLWQLAAGAVNNAILLVGPVETAAAFLGNAAVPSFWLTVLFSLLRIGAGFLAGLLLGLLLAAVSAWSSLAEEFLAPVMTLLKAVPVASFVVLLLIWRGSSFLSAAVSFLVVLPNIYIHTLEGIKNTDRKLLEMAEVFHVPFFNRFFYIYRPALKPFLEGALKISLGMSWKSGVAAEVIGTPAYSMGEKLYLSKIYLETADVFAWTATVILVSFLFERLVMRLWKYFCAWKPRCLPPAGARPLTRTLPPAGRRRRQPDSGEMVLHKVTVKYGELTVLKEIDRRFPAGSISFLTQPSGSGKTTLLRLLAGLEAPWTGSVERCPCSMVFQEDRLCEEYDAVCNVALVTGDDTKAYGELSRLLPPGSLKKPCSQLSGGMKRRVSLVRALSAAAPAILLDEPFSGLDEANRQKAISYIKEKRNGRTLIIATHNPADVESLQI